MCSRLNWSCMADLGGMPKILTFRCLPREKWKKEHSELSDAGKPTAFVWITSESKPIFTCLRLIALHYPWCMWLPCRHHLHPLSFQRDESVLPIGQMRMRVSKQATHAGHSFYGRVWISSFGGPRGDVGGVWVGRLVRPLVLDKKRLLAL